MWTNKHVCIALTYNKIIVHIPLLAKGNVDNPYHYSANCKRTYISNQD